MAFFSGTGDERRRRVLNEQVLAEQESGKTRSSKGLGEEEEADVPAYAETTVENLPSLPRLIATRYLTIALWFLIAALPAVGVEALYLHLPDLQEIVATEHLAPLDVAARGSLAAWYASLLLGLSAVGALVIHSVRRHKIDDYQGRYRIWHWAAFCLLAASLNASTRLHSLVSELATHFSGTPVWADGAFWWMAPSALVLGYVGLRLLMEIRACRTGFALLVLAVASWGTALAGHQGWQPLVSQPHATMILSSCVLGGHVLLLLSLMLYARHVLLDAGGRLLAQPPKAESRPQPKTSAETKEKPKPQAKRKPAKTTAKKSRKVSIDPAHEKQPRPSRQSDLDDAPSQTQWVNGEEDYNDDDERSGSSRKLSKAERKRLRKQKSREARASRR